MQAVVRSDPELNNMTIDIFLAGVQRGMKRDKLESLDKTLNRIQTNAMPKGWSSDSVLLSDSTDEQTFWA